jgi:hypothetical protein
MKLFNVEPVRDFKHFKTKKLTTTFRVRTSQRLMRN